MKEPIIPMKEINLKIIDIRLSIGLKNVHNKNLISSTIKKEMNKHKMSIVISQMNQIEKNSTMKISFHLKSLEVIHFIQNLEKCRNQDQEHHKNYKQTKVIAKINKIKNKWI